jgi:hypothetical protein
MLNTTTGRNPTMRRRTPLLAALIGLSFIASSCSSDKAADTTVAAIEAPAETSAPVETTAQVETTAPTETSAAAVETTASAAAETTIAGSEVAAAGAPGAFAKAHYTTPLADVCPNPLIVQKDWLAEVEHHGLYQLIGGGGKAEQNLYSGPLGSTGIDLKIIDGGPGLGDGATPSSALYAGNLVKGLTPQLAYVYTDDAVLLSKKFPTVAVFAPFESNPQGLMYDPAVYGDITSVDDMKTVVAKGAKIYVTSKKYSYVRFLIAKGVPEDAFVEGYAGDKEKFVVSGGKWLNQGYESSEPYTFSKETPEWNKPVRFVTVNELGLGIYPLTMGVAKDKLAEMSPCLKKLVPIMQQAVVDYLADPTEVNTLVESINAKDLGAPFWKTSIGLNNAATEAFKTRGFVSNGTNTTIGDFDEARVQGVVDLLKPFFTADGSTTMDPAVKASDLFTNEFLDPSIAIK